MNSSPGRLTTALFLGLLALGCELNNGVLRRAAKDYFPLVTGLEWSYSHNDNTTSRVLVRGDTSAWNYPATIVEDDYQEQYWLKSAGEVRKFVSYVVNIGGTDWPLEKRYRRYYVLPFVLGSAWFESFSDTAVILGDTIPFAHDIRGQVVADTTIQVPAGSFLACYEVALTETIAMDDTTVVFTREWYAPGVGLVRREQGTAVKELLDYRFP